MGEEVARRLRQSVPAQIGRRCANDLSRGGELAGNQGPVEGTFRDADGQIDLFLDEIDEPVGQDQVDVDLRVAMHEVPDDGPQLGTAEIRRRGQPQAAPRQPADRPDGLLRLLDLRQQPDTALVIDRAGLGQAELMRRAVDQSHADALLEALDVPAHHRRRELEAPRRLREVLGLHDLGEDPHAEQCVQAPSQMVFQIMQYRM